MIRARIDQGLAGAWTLIRRPWIGQLDLKLRSRIDQSARKAGEPAASDRH